MTHDRPRFDWDDAKNAANQQKHCVSFEDASELFTSGVAYLELFDEAHSEQEDRFLGIGATSRGVLLVVWTERDDDVIRIISARPATQTERRLYRDHMERST